MKGCKKRGKDGSRLFRIEGRREGKKDHEEKRVRMEIGKQEEGSKKGCVRKK